MNPGLLFKIQQAIKEEKVSFTNHSKDEADNDNLRFSQIFNSVMNGDVIEDYPADKPYPSCLIYGRTESGDPVHSVWGYNKESGFVVLITVYKPDPERWIEFRERK